jgi:site-specific recombinase XerD
MEQPTIRKSAPNYIYPYQKTLDDLLERAEKREMHGHKRDILALERNLVNRGITLPTRIKHLQVLLMLSKALDKPFREATKPDVEGIVYGIRTNPRYGPWTVHKHLVCIKRFFKWLYEGEDYPDCVRWIKSTVKEKDTRLPESLLTQDEVKSMMQACDNPRDRCLLSLLNELGVRIGELLSITISSIEEGGDHHRIAIQYSKTKPRKLKAIDSRPYIAQWLNEHPTRDPKDKLFTGLGSTNMGKPLAYPACSALIRRIAERANVTKAVNPHSWRHSTATRYANYMTHAQLCYWFGWAQGSRIPSRYIHLSGQDMDSTLDAMRGKISTKKIENTLTMKTCNFCHTENQGINDLCQQCGSSLNLKSILKKEEEEKLFRAEMLGRQKVLEEYIQYQKEKMEKIEKAVLRDTSQ